MTNEKVTRLPHRLECFGHIGYTVTDFGTAKEAAAFVTKHPAAAMPCWKRCDIVDGELVQVR